MSTQATGLNTELQQQIEAFQREAPPQIPPDSVATLRDTTEDLAKSGIAERSLKVGDKVPDFTLPDAKGGTTKLSDLLKQGPVVISFYRGTWCPYCNLQLRAYQRRLPDLRALGASLVAVSPQTPDNSLSMAEKNQLEFDVLSDVGNAVARQFGLVFSLAEELRPIYEGMGIKLPNYNGDESYELPIPGTFVIGQDGTIRLAHVDADYTHRLEPAAIIASLRTFTTAAREQ